MKHLLKNVRSFGLSLGVAALLFAGVAEPALGSSSPTRTLSSVQQGSEGRPDADDNGNSAKRPDADDNGNACGQPDADDNGNACGQPEADDNGNAIGQPDADDNGNAP